MSLDILNSKQISISCNSLNTNQLNTSGNLTVGGHTTVDTLDVNSVLYFDTVSDALTLEHNRDNSVNGTVSLMVNQKKEYVNDLLYEVGDIVTVTLNLGLVSPLVPVHNLHYICNTNTNDNPPQPEWTYIGVIFDTNQAYPSNMTNVIHNGLLYDAITALSAGAFNPANWTLIGLAPSNVGNNLIFRQTINTTGSSTIFGTNSKDFNGMLEFNASNNVPSEIHSLTGNFILDKPVIGESGPAVFDNRATMFYDISGNLFNVVSRNDDLHTGGFYYALHTISPNNNKTIMFLNETVINEVGPPALIKRYGVLNTDIVNTGGLNLSPNSVAVGYETCGTATLVGGVVIVSTKACGPNSKIFLSLTNHSTFHLYISSKKQTDFTVTSTNNNDTSTFDWMLINPDYNDT